MEYPDKIDCEANGEVIFRTMRSLHLKTIKRSRSQISTKIGIDSLMGLDSFYSKKAYEINKGNYVFLG